MKFYLLASGSYGNATLVETKGHLLLIDMGIRILELKDKLRELGHTLDEIEAILITHEHSDHIKSIKYADLSKVYGTKETLWPEEGYNFIKPLIMFDLFGIHVVPIPISHDIRNGVGYIIDDGEESLVYLTDTGYVKNKYYEYLSNATHYIFESNHDVDMLLKTSRPFYLKRRILSDVGHLSNEDAGDILADLVGDLTKTIVLAHISEDANTKECAYNTVRNILVNKGIDLNKIELKVADRYLITLGREEYAYKK